MAKQIGITKEIAVNDFTGFLSKMGVNSKQIEAVIAMDDFCDQLHVMFESGDLRIDADGNLVQKLSDGQELKFMPKRPKMGDLNRIKPPHYDKMDAENKALLKISFLTGETHKQLCENYYETDLQFGLGLCNFL